MKPISFEVEGRPVPQGSMTASYNRKTKVAHVHHVQGAALALYRASIRQAAKEAMSGQDIPHRAMVVGITFYMQRPNSHIQIRLGKQVVKERYVAAQVTTTPDIDKLVRAVLDAMTGVCYVDDSQVVSIHAEQAYSLTPRTIIQVREHKWETRTDSELERDETILSLWERKHDPQ